MSGASSLEHVPTAQDAVARLTYSSYLQLPQLLRLQAPLTDNPDEMHFIVAHQAIELWFAVVVADVRRIVALVDEDRWVDAVQVLRRTNACAELVLHQTRSLRLLPAESFNRFRTHLGTASGAQSVQFRDLEILCGLRHPDYLRALVGVRDRALRHRYEELLRERSLAQAHIESAARYGVHDWATLYLRPQTFGPLCLLSEHLLEFDELWLRWRSEHLTLVQRMLGAGIRGTGGTDPAEFLGRTLRHRFFPYLWEGRSELASLAADEESRR